MKGDRERTETKRTIERDNCTKKTVRVKCKHVYLLLKLSFPSQQTEVTETTLMDVLKAALRRYHGARGASGIETTLVDFRKKEGVGIVRVQKVDHKILRGTIERTDSFDGYACNLRIVRASHFLVSMAKERGNE